MARLRVRLPESHDTVYEPFQISDPGSWLNLGDCHFPYHSKHLIELAVKDARRQKAVGVLLNGDITDSHEISYFDRNPTKARYIQERGIVLQFFRYLRERLPQARIVYKAGNHEERLDRYLMRNAPALFGFPEFEFDKLFRLSDYGIEFVTGDRVIRLGKLNVVHGHEYKPRVSNPVNAARGIYLRAKAVVLTNHFHHSSTHSDPTITGELQTAWSVGCACELHPKYMPINRWNRGYAMVRVYEDGIFSVRNLQELPNGQVV
jgi:predicted phosphodiesterase